jgi:glycosyltransferase involved in cell wall biosynthesis
MINSAFVLYPFKAIMRKRKSIVMLGTAFETMGGISAVINIYRRAGLFEKFSIVYIPTHTDGSSVKKMILFFRAWLSFVGMLCTGKVGLVHVHTASNASFWRKVCVLLPAFTVGIPTILHLHGGAFNSFYERTCGPLRKRLVREVFGRVDAVIVLSAKWSEWVRSISDNKSIFIVNNPIEVHQADQPLSATRYGILSLCKLGKQKGTFDLLQAVAMLVEKHPTIKLSLGGDGDLLGARREAQRLGISAHVEILGWVTGESKSQLLAASMIYALPSYAEGLPVSLLEAMAAGLPVVSTPVGGIPEAVTDGVEGFLILPGDVDALAGALDTLLDNASLRRRMGYAARNKVELKFSTERILPQIEKIYMQLGA